MNIIYVHGLDSDSQSIKGKLLADYCEQQPQHSVQRPDLNQPPHRVFAQLCDLVASAEQPVLVGSSLGGYFASLVSNHSGCAALLLNPSIQPHVSLQRFFANQTDTGEDAVGYVTDGGWAITRADLQWLAEHRLDGIRHPGKVAVWLKQGDELLDYRQAQQFYDREGVAVILQAGGDHRFSDFAEQLVQVVQTLQQLQAATP